MKTLIIGAHGQIGQLLIEALAKAGQKPRAMIRNPQQADALQARGAETVVADLEDNFSHALEGCNQVVFTAGSGAKTGADKTILVDMWGAMRAVDAARKAGIEHFVMVSSRGAEDPEKGPAKIKHYAVCKKVADDYLIASGVPYTILRPGRLTDDPATDRVTTTRPEDSDAQHIPRQDVARAIAWSLMHSDTRQRIYPLFEGDQPLAEALSAT